MTVLNLDETNTLIAASKVDGTPVYNTKGDKLGTIDDIMINKLSGNVAYSVMSFGGFLGIDAKYHPLPWSMLDYDTRKNGYVVNVSKEQLEKAPMISPEEQNRLRDRAYEKEVHDFYGVPPYWI